jgi:ABC-type nickel/cobalt efflux system permease component RcnA
MSYFIGHGARLIEGVKMAGRVALSHSLAAIVLVLILGATVSKWGRPSGAAETLQTTSYGLITLIGLYYVFQAG